MIASEILEPTEAVDDPCQFDLFLRLHTSIQLLTELIQELIDFVVDCSIGPHGFSCTLYIRTLIQYPFEFRLPLLVELFQRHLHNGHESVPFLLYFSQL